MKNVTRRRLVPAMAGVLAALFLLQPAWVGAKSGPYYSLYLNPFGDGRVGYYFPHDEVNDMGLREAIAADRSGRRPKGRVSAATKPGLRLLLP